MLNQLPKDVQYIIFRYLHIQNHIIVCDELEKVYRLLYDTNVLRYTHDSLLCDRVKKDTQNNNTIHTRMWREQHKNAFYTLTVSHYYFFE